MKLKNNVVFVTGSTRIDERVLGTFQKCTLCNLKVHTFEVGDFDFLDIDQLPLTPESDFGYFVIEGVNP